VTNAAYPSQSDIRVRSFVQQVYGWMAAALAGFDDEEGERKLAIMGALRLYLDFVNLFLLLLRIFGRRR